MRAFFPLFIAFILFTCSPVQKNLSENTAETQTPMTLPSANGIWVETVLQRMTLREKAAQLFVIWTRAGYLQNEGDQWLENLRYARDVGVGGFYFSHGTAYAFAQNANALQREAKIPLLMSADFEWGAGMRIREATSFPKAMALGATRDTNLAYAMGKAVALEARALGIHQNYSPVVDINNNPKNPVINTRSFGEHPELVTQFARAFIRGTQEANVIATVKHFPGHGDTELDTHLDLPTLRYSRSRFDSVELMPFRDAIANGVKSIMVAHIHTLAFEGEDSIPSTASVNVTTTLLKDSLKFQGLIVTDALAMKGISKLFPPGEAAKRSFLAGADILLMSPNTDEAIDSIVAVVQRGEASLERLNYSVRKILQYKQWCGLDQERIRFANMDAISSVVSNGRHASLSREIARKSITILGNNSGILPLQNFNGKKIVDIVFSDNEDPYEADELHDELAKRRTMELIRIDPRSNQQEYDEALKKVKAADIIFCQFMFYTRSEAMTGVLPQKIVEMMNVIASLKKPVIGVTIGNPYVVMDLPKLETYVMTYSQNQSSIQAAAEVIFGEQPAFGKLPISIPGRFAYGEGVTTKTIVLREGTACDVGKNDDSLAMVDAVVEQAIKDSAFPGAVLLAVKQGVIVHHKAYGRMTFDPSSEKMKQNTIFDMASVTKVIATTSAVMKMTEEKKISLSDRIVKYFPAFGQNGKDQITIGNLMVHNSGLPAWKRFYDYCSTPECVLDSIFASSLVFNTGDSTVYSDLGLITVGKIIEQVTGTTLAKYVDSVFFKPLKMESTLFNPPAEWRKRIAPTEVDSFWKKTYTPVRGRVHDENAATLGGISGHAGLFSTASDLAKLLQMELNYGMYGGRRYLDSATIALFTSRQSENSTRAIGWDTRSAGRSFSGTLASSRTFQHTGFTGTSVVVDPENNIIVVFLTNRVYPTRNNLKILRVRPMVHDAIFRALK